MKKMVWMLAFALGCALSVSAQQADRTEMIRKQTDRIVQRYGLNTEQANKLLKLNEEYADKMGGPLMGREGRRGGPGNGMRPQRPDGQEPQASPDGQAPQVRPDGQAPRGERPELTDEQKARMQARRQEMETARKDYDKQVKKIMTRKQYKAYRKDREEMEQRMREGRGDRRPAPQQ